MDNSKSKNAKEKTEFVLLHVAREDVDQIVTDRHEKFSKTDLARQGQMFAVYGDIRAAKALLSVTTKEKAKEAYYKATYDPIFMRARAAAEALGNPKDLHSYLEFEKAGLEVNPFIPPAEILEKTENKIVYGCQICPYADGLRDLAENFPKMIDKDVLEVVLCRCDALDVARANGFNADMKYKRTHFMLADLIGGPESKGCYFEAEVTE